jgi:enoyl-CoA hydratase/carnithine racemase
MDEALDEPACRVLLVEPGSPADAGGAAECLYRLERLRLPAVTWLSGPVDDEALAVALACDIRVAAPDAVLRLSRPQAAELCRRRLSALLPDREYVQSLLDGVSSNAELAHNAGLVSVIAEEAEAEAVRIARILAQRAPIATSLAKEAIWRGLAMPLEQGLRYETDLTMLLISTDDRAEGVAAFLERRQPNFKGT